MDQQSAEKIAETYLEEIRRKGDIVLAIFPRSTIERDFGWVFFWGSNDPSVVLAGNAPFLVDRKNGTVHVTGTAHPLDEYLESYARVGRTFPFAIPEHIVLLEGWESGMLKVSLTKLIRDRTNKSLPEAKHCTDEVITGKVVRLSFSTAADADDFYKDAQKLGALAKRETRFR